MLRYLIEIAGLHSIYALFRQRRQRWLGHLHRMDDGRIPKDLLYGKLEKGGIETEDAPFSERGFSFFPGLVDG